MIFIGFFDETFDLIRKINEIEKKTYLYHLMNRKAYTLINI